MHNFKAVPNGEYRAAQHNGVILVVGRTNLNDGGLQVKFEETGRSIPPPLKFVFDNSGIVLHVLTTYIRCHRIRSADAYRSVMVTDALGGHAVSVEQLDSLEESKERFSWDNLAGTRTWLRLFRPETPFPWSPLFGGAECDWSGPTQSAD